MYAIPNETLSYIFTNLFALQSSMSERLEQHNVLITGDEILTKAQLEQFVWYVAPSSYVEHENIDWNLENYLEDNLYYDTNNISTDVTMLVIGEKDFDLDLLMYVNTFDCTFPIVSQTRFLEYLLTGELNGSDLKINPELRKHAGLNFLEMQGFKWPSTYATISEDPSTELREILEEAPEESWLFKMGYSVRKGIPPQKRHEILKLAVSRHGLQETAILIAGNTRNFKRQKTNRFDGAIQRWEEDLAWLKRNFYDGTKYDISHTNGFRQDTYSFPWPKK